MAETLENIRVIAESYLDVRTTASSPSDLTMLIQNVGVTDLFYSIKETQPAKDSDSFRIFRRGDVITIPPSTEPIWVFSTQVDGLINVENVSSDNIIEEIIGRNENEISLVAQNGQIIALLKAILMGIEIIADQEDSLLEDIDED